MANVPRRGRSIFLVCPHRGFDLDKYAVTCGNSWAMLGEPVTSSVSKKHCPRSSRPDSARMSPIQPSPLLPEVPRSLRLCCLASKVGLLATLTLLGCRREAIISTGWRYRRLPEPTSLISVLVPRIASQTSAWSAYLGTYGSSAQQRLQLRFRWRTPRSSQSPAAGAACQAVFRAWLYRSAARGPWASQGGWRLWVAVLQSLRVAAGRTGSLRQLVPPGGPRAIRSTHLIPVGGARPVSALGTSTWMMRTALWASRPKRRVSSGSSRRAEATASSSLPLAGFPRNREDFLKAVSCYFRVLLFTRTPVSVRSSSRIYRFGQATFSCQCRTACRAAGGAGWCLPALPAAGARRGLRGQGRPARAVARRAMRQHP